MKNLLKIVGLIAIVFIVSIFIPNNDFKDVMTMLASTVGSAAGGKSTGPVPAEYAKNTVKIPSELAAYMKDSSDYGTYYMLNRKFIVSDFMAPNSPYSKAFTDSFTSIAGSSSFTKNYMFAPPGGHSQETQSDPNEVALKKLCHSFCIVNPTRNELYYLDAYGDQEAANLKKTFDDLKGW